MPSTRGICILVISLTLGTPRTPTSAQINKLSKVTPLRRKGGCNQETNADFLECRNHKHSWVSWTLKGSTNRIQEYINLDGKKFTSLFSLTSLKFNISFSEVFAVSMTLSPVETTGIFMPNDGCGYFEILCLLIVSLKCWWSLDQLLHLVI